jgi:Holliday junction resolvase RusA-like endonuclease
MYQGRRFLTKTGKDLKRLIGLELMTQWKHEVLKGDVTVNVIFYFKDNRKDIDNCLKATLDCMTGIIWEDDRQITELHVYKEIDKKNPRVEISVL